MGFLQVLSAVGQFLLVTGAVFVLLCLLTSYLRFQALAEKAARVGEEGMDDHDAFHLKVARLLGSAHRAAGPFGLALLAPGGLPSLDGPDGEALLRHSEEVARGALRAGDTVMRYRHDRIGILLPDATRPSLEAVLHRVTEAVRHQSFRRAAGDAVRVSVSAGVASHPENGVRVVDLVKRVAAALDEAMPRDGACVLAGAPPRLPDPEGAPAGERGAGDQRGLVDPLMGVLRRERIASAVHKYVARYRKNDQPVSFLLLDVDHLDRYNEHYGREAGDDILRGLGDLLQRNTREDDLLGRLGDDEILIVMGCPPRSALVAGQRLVGLIKRAFFETAGRRLKTTVSIGAAGYPDHGGNVRHLLDAADIALNAARESGRNMCLLYEHTMRPTRRKHQPTDVF